jgi:hypothetical protein
MNQFESPTKPTNGSSGTKILKVLIAGFVVFCVIRFSARMMYRHYINNVTQMVSTMPLETINKEVLAKDQSLPPALSEQDYDHLLGQALTTAPLEPTSVAVGPSRLRIDTFWPEPETGHQPPHVWIQVLISAIPTVEDHTKHGYSSCLVFGWP